MTKDARMTWNPPEVDTEIIGKMDYDQGKAARRMKGMMATPEEVSCWQFNPNEARNYNEHPALPGEIESGD